MSLAWGRASEEPGSRAPKCAGAGTGAPGKASARGGKCCRSGAGRQAGMGGGTGSGKRPLPGAEPGRTGRWQAWAVGLNGGGCGVPGSRLPALGSWSRLTAPGAACGDVVRQTLTREGSPRSCGGSHGLWGAGHGLGCCVAAAGLGLSGCWQWAWGRLPKPPPLGVTPLRHGPGFSPRHQPTHRATDSGNKALVRALAWSGPRAGLLLGAGTLPTIPAGPWDHRALTRPGDVT